MSSSPKNASEQADGFRFYAWQPSDDPSQAEILARFNAAEACDVLSVTSIRKLCGETYQLVNWQLGNIANAALGMTKRTITGPRGGKKTVYVRDGEFPGPFVRQMLATNGTQAGLDAVRKWLRDTADEPRDTAAVRGTIVHEAIELNATVDRIDQAYVEAAVLRLSNKDQKKWATKGGVTQEDVDFIAACIANYWDMRAAVPYVILAREATVWNLTAGYGGTADVLIWFLPDGATFGDLTVWQKLADQGAVTQVHVVANGGHVALGDYKTGAGLYTDAAVQTTAYLAAEFIGNDGVIDTRLTEIINASHEAALIHIRPEGWHVGFVDFRADILRAFLGSVAFARFLASYPEADALFTRDLKGKA